MPDKTIERRVRVVQDTDPMNPREWDNAGRMLCWHRRYSLGDKHSYDCDTWRVELACEADDDLADKLDYIDNDVSDALYCCYREDGGMDYRAAADRTDDAIRKVRNGLIDHAFDAGYVALPLYLYDHSGITMSTGGFSCPWDSGCVGVIVCDKETIQREFDGDRGEALRALEAEVKAYDDYITGNYYVLLAEEREDDGDWDCVDSIGGIEGDYITDAIGDHFGDDFKGCEEVYE